MPSLLVGAAISTEKGFSEKKYLVPEKPHMLYIHRKYEYRIGNIEYDVDQLENTVADNGNEICQLKSRTSKLEADAAARDYYFKHDAET